MTRQDEIPPAPDRGLWAAVLRQAHLDWSVSPRGVVLLLLGPLVLTGIAGALSVGFKPTMRFLEQEDGPMEWLQVVCFAAGAYASARLAWRYRGDGRLLPAAAFGVLTAGLVFIVGEELAWGQRVLHFSTPAALAEANEKEEVSIHNITTLTGLFKVAKLSAALYGLLGAAYLLRLRSADKDSFLRPFLVPAFLVSPFFVVLVMRISRLIFLRHTIPTGFSESEETILAFGMAAFCVLAWRAQRLTQSDSPS